MLLNETQANRTAPPWCVGLFAQYDMMAATFEKPRRVAEGTSGCIPRRHQGPLVAAWGARVVSSGKGCARSGERTGVPSRRRGWTCRRPRRGGGRGRWGAGALARQGRVYVQAWSRRRTGVRTGARGVFGGLSPPAPAPASFPESRGAARPRWRRLAAGAAGCPVPTAKWGSTGRRIPRPMRTGAGGRSAGGSNHRAGRCRYGSTCTRWEDQSRVQNLYAPPWWVGLLAQMDMMAAMLLKPRRFVEGTSGCMHRGHWGPLVAACRTRLLRSEKGCSSCGRRRLRSRSRGRARRRGRCVRRAWTSACRRGCRTSGRGPSSRRTR